MNATETLVVVSFNGESYAAVPANEAAEVIAFLRRGGADVTSVRRPATVAQAMVQQTVDAHNARQSAAKAMREDGTRDAWTWGTTSWSANRIRQARELAAL